MQKKQFEEESVKVGLINFSKDALHRSKWSVCINLIATRLM